MREKIYDLEVVTKPGITYQVTYGGAILINSNYNSEVLCWIPSEVAKVIKDTWKDYNYYLESDGWISREATEN